MERSSSQPAGVCAVNTARHGGPHGMTFAWVGCAWHELQRAVHRPDVSLQNEKFTDALERELIRREQRRWLD
jgi:hypothetical protein